MRSLVVDDDFICRSTLLAQLLPFGSCNAAADGIEALQAISRAQEEGWSFDLICLDIDMPTISGHEVLRALRQQEGRLLDGPRAIVIMTSSHSESNQVKSAFVNQADGFLVKPIRSELLRVRLLSFGLIAG